jgi:hypothetical protein
VVEVGIFNQSLSPQNYKLFGVGSTRQFIYQTIQIISQEWSFRKKKSKKRLTKTKKKKPKLIATSFQTTCQLNNTFFFPSRGKK